MSHEEAKTRLRQAKTLGQRQEAVQQAIELGMPLKEIEEYLDWLDSVRQNQPDKSQR